jgi:Swi5-dependent recombination DNA repair protein 1
LERLIVRWRRCAQKCAERLFVEARNRIDRMGGFREYLTRQKETNNAQYFQDGNEKRYCEGDEVEIEDEHAEAMEKEEEGDEFTMEYMLKMAGVDEELMGWDRNLNNFRKADV